MMLETYSNYSSGIPGGTLSIDHGQYPASSALPSNGDFIWSNGTGISVKLRDFALTTDNASPNTVPPIVDFSLTGGGAHNIFTCHGCTGFTKQNFNVAVPGNNGAQLTYVENDAPGGSGLGEHGVNWLQNGDSAGLDDFRLDVNGKVRVMGGYLNVLQLTAPSYMWNFSCATSGSTTYYYKITSVSGGLETTPSSEFSVSSCANTVSGTNTIAARFFGDVGADSYKVYRSTAAGGPGSEKYAFTVPANTGNGTMEPGYGNPNSFTDAIPDGSLGAVPPTVNTTGLLQSSFYLGPATAPTGACSTNGVWVLSQDGALTECKSGTWTGWTPTSSAPPAMTITPGTHAGTGATASCLTSGGARCTIYSGEVQWTTGTGPTSNYQVNMSYTALPYTLVCTITPQGSASFALGLFGVNAVSGSLSVSANVAPAAATTYYFTYSCNY
jgi:hypothetical protein